MLRGRFEVRPLVVATLLALTAGATSPAVSSAQSVTVIDVGAPGADGSSGQDGGAGGASVAEAVGALLRAEPDTQVRAEATGGAGGVAGAGADGGHGGHAMARSTVVDGPPNTSPSQSRPIDSVAVAVGGAGGDASGAGSRAGDGGRANGSASLDLPNALIPSHEARPAIELTGGAGGVGHAFADGGDGGDIDQVDGIAIVRDDLGLEASATARGGDGGASYGGQAGSGGDADIAVTLFHGSPADSRLDVIARGGDGGEARTGGVAGAAGNAVARAELESFDGSQGSVTSNAEAYGGSGAASAADGVSGVAGGSARAASTARVVIGPDSSTVVAYAVATGGTGGAGRGVGQRGGDGGEAQAIAESSSDANASRDLSLHTHETGGTGGAGFAGADGGTGASIAHTSDFSVPHGTNVQRTHVMVGGDGGASEGGLAGDGGAAQLNLEGVSDSTGGSTFDVSGGSGGQAMLGGTGGRGGDAAITGVLAAPGSFASNRVLIVSGGAGGGVEAGHGDGGAGGNAVIDVDYDIDGYLRLTDRLQGGDGGSVLAGATGNGGQGGNVTLTTVTTADREAGDLRITGGSGGDGRGAGNRGGDAGTISLDSQSQFTGTGSVQRTVHVAGGRGGAGFDGADAGRAADVALEDALRFDSASPLSVNQYVYGGDGGSASGSTPGVAARGGDARSVLNLEHAGAGRALSQRAGYGWACRQTGRTRHAVEVGYAAASGEASGSVSVYALGLGGLAGLDGTGGEGLLGPVSGVSTGGERVVVDGEARGGDGKLASTPGFGGHGGDATAVDAVDGRTSGALQLNQTAIGGNGGCRSIGAFGCREGGDGGDAISRLTRVKEVGSLGMSVTAVAGYGGREVPDTNFPYYINHVPGSADAYGSGANEDGSAVVSALARGGDSSSIWSSAPDDMGHARAEAHASSPVQAATASARATAGRHEHLGPLSRIVNTGGVATAASSATGPSGSAFSTGISGGDPFTHITATAKSTLPVLLGAPGSVATTHARIRVDGQGDAIAAEFEEQAGAYAYVSNGRRIGNEGVGVLGGRDDVGVAHGDLTLSSSIAFDTAGNYHMAALRDQVLRFHGLQSSGEDFASVTFVATTSGIRLVDQTFGSLAEAIAFFSRRYVIGDWLDAAGVASARAIAFQLDVVTDHRGQGFQVGFTLSSVPEPGTALLVVVGLVWLGVRARRQ